MASVRKQLRRRFEHAKPGVPPLSIRLDKLTSAAHTALCQLTGRRSRMARSMTLDIIELDEQLRRAGLADSLRDALEQLDGPIIAQARLRQALQEQWSELAASTPMEGVLRIWLDGAPDVLSRLKRLGRTPEGAAQLLSAADAILHHLPAQGQPRSQLAASVMGDAHALDAGRPVASLVLAAWRHSERSRSADAVEDAETELINPATTEERQRDVWARAGVLVNELARPALLLNLPVADPAQAFWIRGEPAYLSLRQLLRTPPTWAVAGKSVFVCENPNVLAIAADDLGTHCAPLVCTDGMPAAAQRTLLYQLQKAGACLHYHGDFDWPGIGIANFVIRTWQATPWRLSASDYEAATRASFHSRHNLEEMSVTATWDSRLAPTMQQHGIAIAEETVVATLLADLCDEQ
ncbi:TIGR02679 family protein [Dyella jejuensis]